MRDSDVDLYTHDRLLAEFGPFAESLNGQLPATAERDLLGQGYRKVLGDMAKIVAHQWREHLERSALKGFLLYGGVGVGKTTMAKRLTYELCRLFGDHGEMQRQGDEVVLVLVDGADIARGRYGETEEQLRDLFAYARDGQQGRHHHDDEAKRRTVLLFDDVESLFMTRNSSSAKEWHFSQNSVFFHNVDELDTGHVALVLTTNRIDLLDDAIVDRFMPLEFGAPPAEVLLEVAVAKGRQQGLNDAELKPILKHIRAHKPKSIREVERLVLRTYVQKVTKA
ncbi:MAG TPA: ATP-binding protein [Chloroflexota bacterium]|nr:ATP-binding protein [Chloroflexota bacterium]